MKRLSEKVKDIVEVRSFAKVRDLAADPAETLGGYRFTDITADLMGKWLDAVVSVQPGRGAAYALAGFRGVGKSHFLSTLAAIVSQPELRDGINDGHVGTAAGRLSRRHSPVLFVKRGTRTSLIEELKAAVAIRVGSKESELSDSLNDLLLQLSDQAGDNPVVILIDTAMERETRVTRDDGPLLGQIADAASSMGHFVGLALDDDIAGADGANLAISGSFSIDYLDQEHLYKIVDAHIFAKKEASLPLLHEIYKGYHDALPRFRWSEQRFTSLYPLHPATLEIAPLIRLYLHDFALLGFAAEAGVKILGRPANSLIGLDEVFDAVEKRLREVDDLKEALAAFDRLDQEVIAKTAVGTRLLAKLILKGLFMLSLDGSGTTASSLAAAMLVTESGEGGLDIPALLESFHNILPEDILKNEGEGEPKYAFKLKFAEDLKAAIDSVPVDIPAAVIADILIRQAGEKFSDLTIIEGHEVPTSLTTIVWKGSLRHGEIRWALGSPVAPTHASTADWTVTVKFASEASKQNILTDRPAIEWLISPLKPEELEAIRRLYVLQTDEAVREQFKERATSEIQIQSLAVEKIWKRIFLTDSRLSIDGTESRLSDDAAHSHTLAQLFALTLPAVMDYRFPSHPDFAETLGIKEAGQLTAKFFGNASPTAPDVQHLAETFAAPLGLAEFGDEGFVPARAEVLAELPLLKNAFDGLELKEATAVPIAEISRRLSLPPFGLSREGQHLLLSALVGAKQIEFVTSSGNRINHRSLDLQILWDDIAGIAKPFAETYSAGRLVEWARLVTGNPQLRSLDRSEDRLVVIDTLSGWLTNWRDARFLDTFEALPDEDLNSGIWRTAANLRKTFGALAERIDRLIQDQLPLDRCLNDIAELFSDSQEEYEAKKNDLLTLRYFTSAAIKRREILKYLAVSETTSEVEVEELRAQLLSLTGPSFFKADRATNAHLEETWAKFRDKYSAHYLARHDATMNSQVAAGRLKELLGSDRWAVFQSFSESDLFDRDLAAGAHSLVRRVRNLGCSFDAVSLLATQPFCSCSFRLARFDRRKDGSARLEIMMAQGLSQFAADLNARLDELKKIVRGETGPVLRRCLANSFDADALVELNSYETSLLRAALQKLSSSEARSRPQADPEELLSIGTDDWDNEIDNLEVFANSTI